MAHKPVPPSDSVAAILQRSETAAARWRKAGRVAEATVVEDLLALVRDLVGRSPRELANQENGDG